ncbi:MAG: hypothetical protein WA949_01835 [Phormidesmis sp.]
MTIDLAVDAIASAFHIDTLSADVHPDAATRCSYQMQATRGRSFEDLCGGLYSRIRLSSAWRRAK